MSTDNKVYLIMSKEPHSYESVRIEAICYTFDYFVKECKKLKEELPSPRFVIGYSFKSLEALEITLGDAFYDFDAISGSDIFWVLARSSGDVIYNSTMEWPGVIK